MAKGILKKFAVIAGNKKTGSPAEDEHTAVNPIKEISGKAVHCREAVKKAEGYLLALQNQDGFWVFELEADVTIPSEYIMLQRFLGREISPELGKRLENYLLDRQLPDGGWPLYAEDGFANISATVKAYLALKVLGHSPQAPHMIRARLMVLSLGGAAKCNVFTRILLALFGQLPWHTPPAMPVEIVLLPRWFFFHLSKVSYWSRTVIVPLLLLYARKPVCRLRPGEGIPELFITPPDKLRNLDGFQPGAWRKNAFIILDRLIKRCNRFIPSGLHRRAIAEAETWTRSHMQGSGGIGAIFPAMAYAVMALRVLGCGEDDPDYTRGLQAVDDLLQHRTPRESSTTGTSGACVDSGSSAALAIDPSVHAAADGMGTSSICQPCNSPIWDTCLSLSALMEAGMPPDHPAVNRAVEWLLSQQIHSPGDWSLKVPDLEGGGWAFQFENTLYPDLDDTSKVIMSLLRGGALENGLYRDRIARGVNWVLGMQSSDGGWAAFDIDNNYHYLNDIPFADHGALLDPSTSDLTGRCIELLSMAGFDRTFPPIARGISFLRSEQEDNGAWFGRWGVNYIYGTWSVLSGLAQAGEDMQQPYIRKAVGWLMSCQNHDGGWGETCYSYDDPSLAGKGASTPSQTAWSLLGLMAAGEVHSLPVRRGVRYLLDHQNQWGTWEEKHFTGTGFPRVFYLRYDGYRHFFPLWALGVYSRLSTGQRTCQNERRHSTPGDLHLPWLERIKGYSGLTAEKTP